MKFTSVDSIRADIESIEARVAEIVEQERQLANERSGLTATKDRLSQALVLVTNTVEPLSRSVAVQVQVLGESEKETEPQPPPKTSIRRSHKPGGSIAKELRDVIVAMDGEFTMQDLTEATGRGKSTLWPHFQKLMGQGVVVKLDHTRPRPTGVGGPGHKLYKYNTEFPPGPTERPKETPPEKELIGATPPRGRALGAGEMSDGKIFVSDSMIQGFINAAYQQGWTVEWKDARNQGGNHLKFISPIGATVGVNAKPASKQVGLIIKRDLKRSGLKLA